MTWMPGSSPGMTWCVLRRRSTTHRSSRTACREAASRDPGPSAKLAVRSAAPRARPAPCPPPFTGESLSPRRRGGTMRSMMEGGGAQPRNTGPPLRTLHRHGRACPGHPRVFVHAVFAWMPGSSPGMTWCVCTRRSNPPPLIPAPRAPTANCVIGKNRHDNRGTQHQRPNSELKPSNSFGKDPLHLTNCLIDHVPLQLTKAVVGALGKSKGGFSSILQRKSITYYRLYSLPNGNGTPYSSNALTQR